MAKKFFIPLVVLSILVVVIIWLQLINLNFKSQRQPDQFGQIIKSSLLQTKYLFDNFRKNINLKINER